MLFRSMKAPFGFIELDTLTWFNLAWWLAAAVFLYGILVYSRRPLPQWTPVFSALFVIFLLTWLFVAKNARPWSEGDHPLLPTSMKAPFFDSIELDTLTWFSLAWWFAAAAFLYIFIVHTRRPLPLLSGADVGNGQLLHWFILWVYLIANTLRALPFSEGRLVTEWVVFVNASLATALIATLPTAPLAPSSLRIDLLPRLRPIWAKGLAATVVVMFAYAVVLKFGYGGHGIEDPRYAHRRFGPDAIWRIAPILKHGEHR